MKPGSRLFWTFKKIGNILDLVGELIVWRTGRDEVHEAISPDGQIWYEDTVTFEPHKLFGFLTIPWWPHSGPIKHKIADGTPWSYVMEPICDIPAAVQLRMIAYAEKQIQLRRPYNWLELIAMLWIWPLRGFYRVFGRVPFSAAFLGNFCSVFAEKIWLAGWSTVPLSDEDFSPPGEVAQSPMLVKAGG